MNADLDSIYQVMKKPPELKVWRRFIAKVAIGRITECWLWQAYITEQGYGSFRSESGTKRAHTWLGIWIYGEIKPWVMDHLVCSNRACANPTHLLPTTRKQNTIRRGSRANAAVNVLKTHCKNGHELSSENVFDLQGANKGKRICKICAAQRHHDRYVKTGPFRRWWYHELDWAAGEVNRVGIKAMKKLYGISPVHLKVAFLQNGYQYHVTKGQYGKVVVTKGFVTF